MRFTIKKKLLKNISVSSNFFVSVIFILLNESLMILKDSCYWNRRKHHTGYILRMTAGPTFWHFHRWCSYWSRLDALRVRERTGALLYSTLQVSKMILSFYNKRDMETRHRGRVSDVQWTIPIIHICNRAKKI